MPQEPQTKISIHEDKIREELLKTKKQISEQKEPSEDLIKKQEYLMIKSKWLEINKGKALVPGRFDEYDLVLPIGSSCHVTMMVDYFRLKRFSSPFDWTGGMEPTNWHQDPNVYRDSRFYEKIQAICDNFKDWANPNDFKYVSQWLSPQKPHHRVVNIRTRVQYTHEFPSNQDILQYMPEFLEKTKRRIDHLYSAINKSKKILIIWIARIWDQCTILDQNVSYKDIIYAIEQMNKKYPDKTFDFVFFEHDGAKGRFEFQKITVAPNAFRIKSNHFLQDNEYEFVHKTPDDMHRHVHLISEMLDNIHLSANAFSLPKTNA